MKSSVQFSPNRHLDNISKMFSKLYNDEKMADVTLCCKDGSIKAHKIILATSSPYFHRIFTENNRDHPIIIIPGITYHHLLNLLELIYKGVVDVPPEELNPLYELAGEFQLIGISGVLREENDETTEKTNSPRDTRFKGMKRVVVDYSNTNLTDENKESSPSNNTSSESIEIEDKTSIDLIDEPVAGSSPNQIQATDDKEKSDNQAEAPKLTAWAKKQRKFKCDLCPSSFKRSSHLTRHQLVHTGERPFACDQCDKAFSRHDKLKHHIRKTHEEDEEYKPDYSYQFQPTDLVPSRAASPLPFVISHVRSEALEANGPSPVKRPRGRPRKYPVVEKPLIKRGRGRPRLNSNKCELNNGENYDITNLPYGDLEYLTMPIQDSIIEPFVEIKTEKDENPAGQKTTNEVEDKAIEVPPVTPSPANLKDLENRIAKIGECTISVANH